jgi:hypothetical protein
MTAAFDIGPTEHQPTFVSVDQEILRRALATADDAVEFISEALAAHDTLRGRTTMRNQAAAIYLEKHLTDAKTVASELRTALGFQK